MAMSTDSKCCTYPDRWPGWVGLHGTNTIYKIYNSCHSLNAENDQTMNDNLRAGGTFCISGLICCCCCCGCCCCFGCDCLAADNDEWRSGAFGSTCVGRIGRWSKPPGAWTWAEALAPVLGCLTDADLATEVTVSLVWRSILTTGFAPAADEATLLVAVFVPCISSAPNRKKSSINYRKCKTDNKSYARQLTVEESILTTMFTKQQRQKCEDMFSKRFGTAEQYVFTRTLTLSIN